MSKREFDSELRVKAPSAPLFLDSEVAEPPCPLVWYPLDGSTDLTRKFMNLWMDNPARVTNGAAYKCTTGTHRGI